MIAGNKALYPLKNFSSYAVRAQRDDVSLR